jgi:antitoxin VapB
MKTARLFRNGQSQAVRLPKEYRFSGDRVLIKKAGNALVLLPEKGSWKPLFESLSKFSDDFMENREQPGQKPRNKLFE